MTFTQLVSNLHVYEQLHVCVTSSTYRIVEIIGEIKFGEFDERTIVLAHQNECRA